MNSRSKTERASIIFFKSIYKMRELEFKHKKTSVINSKGKNEEKVNGRTK